MVARPVLAVLSVVALLAQPVLSLAEGRPAPAAAQAGEDLSARIARLSDTMKMGDLFEIMRSEGLDYGKSLEGDLFAGQSGTGWATIVGRIYDIVPMRQHFDAAFTKDLAPAGEDLARIEGFFGSERGQRIVKLEVEARRALLDPAAEEAAKQAWADMKAKDDPRVALLNEFVQANDLIESNVMGTMNSNVAFYQGMAEFPVAGADVSEDQILSDVWGQEADIRAETTDWLYSYLALAYGALSDEDLQAYIDFSKSSAGKKMNAALFDAFDVVFTRISRDLGRAAAKQAQGQDI
jgi:hypothetical protein